MSWAITKKAINSDLSKPLNELIESESKAINSDLSTPINEKLGRVQVDGGFDGAVLSGCELDGDKVVLTDDDTVADSQVLDNGNSLTLSGNTRFSAGRFTALRGTSNINVSIKAEKTGTPASDLEIHIYNNNDSTNRPQSSIASASIPSGDISTLDIFDVDISVDLVVGQTYYVVARTELGDSSNFYIARVLSAGGTGNFLESFNGGATWQTSSGDMWFLVIDNDGATLGTATQTIEPSSLYKFENIFFNKVTPANTSISCIILDADDNELIASVSDKGSLASIDTTIYKSIKAEWTLTRVATTDDSPELHSAFWTWTGKLEEMPVNWADKTFQTSTLTATEESNTQLDIEGSGYLVSVIGTAGNNVAVTIQIDGGSIYRIVVNNNSVPLFPIRFNSNLVIKSQNAVSANLNSWVVLD